MWLKQILAPHLTWARFWLCDHLLLRSKRGELLAGDFTLRIWREVKHLESQRLWWVIIQQTSASISIQHRTTEGLRLVNHGETWCTMVNHHILPMVQERLTQTIREVTGTSSTVICVHEEWAGSASLVVSEKMNRQCQ
jgi:hypothetical protein